MSVHTTGPLAPTPDDLRITHRGREIALKLIDWGSSIPILSIIERKPAGWEAAGIVYEFSDRSDGVGGLQIEKEAAEMGGVANWVKKVLVPAINKSLAQMFLPGVVEPPVGEYPATVVGVDQAMRAVLKWAPQADGTLKVTA